jgi:hypothetical protein
METYFLYFKCFASLVIGLTVHFAQKFEQQKALAAGPYTWADFWNATIVANIVNALCAAFWMLIVPDGVKAVPQVYGSVFLANIVHISACFAVGYFNSAVILKIAEAWRRHVLRKVRERADGKDAG